MSAPRHIFETYIRATPEAIWQAITDPAFTQRYSGHRAAMPAMAASTWSHSRSRRQMAPMAATGSKASDDVVPAVAHTKKGTSPARRSAATAAARVSGCRA